MSIKSEIARIQNNVANSLSAVRNKGVSVPAGANSDNLPGLIAKISGGGASVEEITNGAGGKSVYINSEVPKPPDGYTRLQYIQSTGTQYINTGYTPNSNTRVVLNAYNLSASSSWAFGAWTSSSSRQFAYSCGSYGFRYGSTNATMDTAPVGSLQIDFNKNAYNRNGTTGTMSEQTFTCEYPFFLFTINAKGTASSGKFTGQVSSCQIYDDGVLVRDYAPYLNASGVAGLYDMVNGVFYGDAAGGAFVAGPELVLEDQFVSKVVLEDETIIDLTGDTVTPEALLSGFTAHDAMGQLIQGAASAGKPVASGTVSANSTNVATVSGLPFKPSVVFMYYNQQSSISNNTNMSVLADIEGSFYSTDRALYDSYNMVTSYNRRGGTSYVNVVVTDNGFTITLEGGRYGGSYRWYAIGAEG